MTTLRDTLIDLTNPGDMVLDRDLRLWRTENHGRLCCGVKLDPRDVEVTLRRKLKFDHKQGD
jgi:hypothetical protein